MSSANGIQGFSIHEPPIAVIDFITAGLTPGLDGVVEASINRLESEEKSHLAFDTMVNPQRPMSVTEIYHSNLENSMGVCCRGIERIKEYRVLAVNKAGTGPESNTVMAVL